MSWQPLVRSERPCQPGAGPGSSATVAAPSARRLPIYDGAPLLLTSPSAVQGNTIQHVLQIGKYLVSPLVSAVPGGAGDARFGAAVSIRSGRGSMTHDRVVRFVPDFGSHEEATRFAVDQARAWIDERGPASDRFVAPFN